jgi:1,4-dihydroxy-2-naphthoate octaprenyltransferase
MGTFNAKFWFAGVRPKTLVASVSPILLGSAWVITQIGDSYFRGLIFTLALLSALSIQIATNFINDAMDFKKGTDTKDRIGPLRIVNAGLATYEQVLKVAIGFIVLAVLFGAPLVWIGGLPILIIGLISLFLAYSYTAGPFPLAYLGLGELFVTVFFGMVPVSSMTYLYTQSWSLSSILLGVLVGLMASSLILINNMRDMDSDRKAGRKTLPIRFGKKVTFGFLSFFLLLPPILSSIWVVFKASWLISLLPLFVIPSCIRLLVDIWKRPPSPLYNEFLGRAGAIQLRWTVFVIATLFVCSKFGYQLTL